MNTHLRASSLHEGTVGGKDALFNFVTYQYALLPAKYLLQRSTRGVIGATDLSTNRLVSLDWQSIQPTLNLTVKRPN